jgi:alkanesulfonate monooxygenase SsuD/methylene tetrahydromethanopterin reductase-like flavin-dependent oxidoreductase (luciferase family)
MADESGRDPRAIRPAVVVFLRVGGSASEHQRGLQWLSDLYGLAPSRFERHLVSGSPSACVERVEQFRSAGAEHVAVMVADDHPLEHWAPLVEGGRETDRRAAGTATAASTPAAVAEGRRDRDVVGARA